MNKMLHQVVLDLEKKKGFLFSCIHPKLELENTFIKVIRTDSFSWNSVKRQPLSYFNEFCNQVLIKLGRILNNFAEDDLEKKYIQIQFLHPYLFEGTPIQEVIFVQPNFR